MNPQIKVKHGQIVSRGIEWCDYTFNPIGGCLHECRWTMPDGNTAICYAENTAENSQAKPFYPEGFAHHYWHPAKLDEPMRVRKPAKIFVGSMADVFGSWVPDEQIEAVLSGCKSAHWHTFQFLTKNAPRLLKFKFPPNVWIGVSSPPDYFMGKQLSQEQKERMLSKSLEVLSELDGIIRWMSFEPLSHDYSKIVAEHSALDWAVIGAATNGPKKFQPLSTDVENLLKVLDGQKVKTFFKGNLDYKPHREDFPNPIEAQPALI